MATRTKKKAEIAPPPPPPPVEETKPDEKKPAKASKGKAKSKEVPLPPAPPLDPVEELKQQLSAAQERLVALQAELDESAGEAWQMRGALGRAEAAAKEAQQRTEELAVATARTAELEQELTTAREWSRELDQKLDEAGARADTLEQELETARERLPEVEEELAGARERIEALEQEVQGRANAAEQVAQTLQSRIQQLNVQLERAENRVTELEPAGARVETLEVEWEEQRTRIETLSLEVEELELLKEDLEESIVDRRREVKALRQSEKEARALADGAQALRDEVDARLAEQSAAHLADLAKVEQRLQQETVLRRAQGASVEGLKARLADADKKLQEAEQRASQALAALEVAKAQPVSNGAAEKRAQLLEAELALSVREMSAREQAQVVLEREKRQIGEDVRRLTDENRGLGVEIEQLKARLASAPTPANIEDEVRLHKVRADELRESLRTQRTENSKLQERLDYMTNAKTTEENMRKEVETKLRIALRTQLRQQGS